MIDFALLRTAIGGGAKKLIAAIRKKAGKQFDADDEGCSLGRATTYRPYAGGAPEMRGP